MKKESDLKKLKKSLHQVLEYEQGKRTLKTTSIGSDLDAFLKEENILAKSKAIAKKRVLTYSKKKKLKEEKGNDNFISFNGI